MNRTGSWFPYGFVLSVRYEFATSSKIWSSISGHFIASSYLRIKKVKYKMQGGNVGSFADSLSGLFWVLHSGRTCSEKLGGVVEVG
jgi:hypothetical protein